MRLLGIILIFLISLNSSSLPDSYYKIKNTKLMKEAFFSFISELAIKENNAILDDRNFIKKYYAHKDTLELSSVESNRFLALQKRYKLKENSSLKMYLKKIDIVPISLILSQAAIESGWGKSRFFKEANNIFGQWTWSGKGLIPRNRLAGAKHRIKIFATPRAAVRGYLINLNTHKAYKDLRRMRESLRVKNKTVSGYLLSETLINYSQKKEKYIVMIKQIIRKSKLKKWDTL